MVAVWKVQGDPTRMLGGEFDSFAGFRAECCIFKGELPMKGGVGAAGGQLGLPCVRNVFLKPFKTFKKNIRPWSLAVTLPMVEIRGCMGSSPLKLLQNPAKESKTSHCS